MGKSILIINYILNMFKAPGRRPVKLGQQPSTNSINTSVSVTFGKQFNNYKREEQWDHRHHINHMNPYNLLFDMYAGG